MFFKQKAPDIFYLIILMTLCVGGCVAIMSIGKIYDRMNVRVTQVGTPAATETAQPVPVAEQDNAPATDIAPRTDDIPRSSSMASRNNNPCNIKGRGWQGQTGQDRFGHAVFDCVENGLRACAVTLANYERLHNVRTVSGIVRRFTTSDNPAYVAYLSKKLGVGADDALSMREVLPKLLRHVARYESGVRLPERLFAPYDIVRSLK